MERKLATVLFVDLVDSTSLVTGSDPEVVRRRVQAYFDRVSRCVTAHGGIVEKFAGDAVMAAFGIPQAHEDDAERAVRAGLSILEAVHGLGLEARIGIESGEVVADDSDSTFATGEAVTVAARLERRARAPAEPAGPADRPRRRARPATEHVRPGAARPPCAPVHDLRRAGRRQEPPLTRVQPGARGLDRPRRPQPSLRRGRHLL